MRDPSLTQLTQMTLPTNCRLMPSLRLPLSREGSQRQLDHSVLGRNLRKILSANYPLIVNRQTFPSPVWPTRTCDAHRQNYNPVAD